jgi:hypothetical protein
MAYATKITWSGGYRDTAPTCPRDCCSADFGDWSLWVERLNADTAQRWFWTVDEGPDDTVRSVACGCERTEAQARQAAEKAARHLARPRLRIVA